MQIYEYIAKQLNDHENQCHGVKQGSYTTWSLDHIQDAVQLGLEYIYSIHLKHFLQKHIPYIKDKILVRLIFLVWVVK